MLTSYPDGKVTAELLQLTEDSSIDRKVVDRIFAHLTKTITPLSVFASNTANALRSGFRPGRRFW